MITGTVAVLVANRRVRLPLCQVPVLIRVPLLLIYALGWLNCLLAGDGTCGRPTDRPKAMTFRQCPVPTLVAVHPSASFMRFGTFVIAGLLDWAGMRDAPPVGFTRYRIPSGVACFLIEFLQINRFTPLRPTKTQRGSALPGVIDAVILVRHRGRGAPAAADTSAAASAAAARALPEPA